MPVLPALKGYSISMKQRKMMQLAMSALVSVWIAGSLSVTALRSLGIDGATGQALLACAAAAAFGVLVSLGRIPALITGAATIGAGVWMGVSHLDGIRAFLAELPQKLETGFVAADLTGLLLPAVLVLAVVWTLFIFGSTHTHSGGFFAMIFVLLYWLLLRSLAGPLEIWLMAVTLVGVAALFAVPVGGYSNYLKALLPTAVIAAVAAMALLPAEGTTFKPLEDAADKVRSVFQAYFSFTDTRVPYSISMDGYHPLGETLGGPAEPHQWPVMEVATEKDLYLRGTIRRTYVNTAWTDAMASSRYLFNDIMKQGVREAVFESDRVNAENSGGAFAEIEAQIDMMTEGTSTLFVPHRVDSLKPALDIAVYYNTVGDVFITRDVQEGDSYAIEAVVPTGDQQALAAYVGAHWRDDDPMYAQAVADFTQLPQYIEQGVYEIVAEITAGAMTDYQKAAAIEQYLEQKYTYTLDVDYPRNDRDFVSEFLLGSKEGYCSYFASAMAVMGRIAGLPTRYVEGYRVQATPLGTSVVTGEDAHAWVEVYMNGVGWVTFDPTPGSGYSDEDDNETDEPGNEAGGTPEPTEEAPNADAPTEEPTEEPSQEPDTPDVTPEPTEDSGIVPPTWPPEHPESEPTPPPQEPDHPKQDDDSDWMKWLIAALILLLLILLLALAAYLRLKASDPNVVAARFRKQPLIQLMVYYRAVLTLLEMTGQVPESGESPAAFGRRLARTGVADRAFAELSNRVTMGQYAGKGATEADVKLAAKVYASLAKQLRGGEKLRWRWVRIRHGMGSFEQIP